jgi:hypothetical protein
MPGKTPMWGNPTRERDRDIIQLSGKYIATSITIFQPRENPLTTQKQSPTNLSLKPWHSPYNYTDLLKVGTSKFIPQQAVVPCPLYGRPPSEILQGLPQKSCPSLPRFLCLKYVVVQLVRIHTV